MKVHTIQKAAKDYPQAGIKKGDTYYWWKFRRGGKRISKTYPTRKDLTQSDFLQQLYGLEDRLAEITNNMNAEELDNFPIDDLESLISDIETLKDETQEKLDNMPESLQQSSSTGELLQERIDALESWQGELERVKDTIQTALDEMQQAKESLQEAIDELPGIEHGL